MTKPRYSSEYVINILKERNLFIKGYDYSKTGGDSAYSKISIKDNFGFEHETIMIKLINGKTLSEKTLKNRSKVLVDSYKSVSGFGRNVNTKNIQGN